MSLEKLKEIDATSIPIGKFISMIEKSHKIYLNHNLEYLNINSNQLHVMFEIRYNAGINQEEISERCNTDKGAIARTIKKLEDKELIYREIDSNNRRQNIVSLTEKGEEVISEAEKNLNYWEEEIFGYLNREDKEKLQNQLKEILIKTILLNMDLKGCKNDKELKE